MTYLQPAIVHDTATGVYADPLAETADGLAFQEGARVLLGYIQTTRVPQYNARSKTSHMVERYVAILGDLTPLGEYKRRADAGEALVADRGYRSVPSTSIIPDLLGGLRNGDR